MAEDAAPGAGGETAASAALKVAPGQPELPEAGRLNLFISYSRDDTAFADELTGHLDLLGYQTSIDRHSITAGDDWRARLGALIAAADTVVFVLSPSSARSDMCRWEVEETARLGKRILPVVVRQVPSGEQPDKLRELQQTFFTEGQSFAKGLGELRRALDTDLAWVREHTRLTAMAERWSGDPVRTKSMGDHVLLQGADIDDAERRLKRVPRTGPLPSPTLIAFVAASREAANRRAGEQQQALQERERLLAAAEAAQQGTARMQARIGRLFRVLAAVIVAVMGWQVWQSFDLARRETLVYTSLATQAYAQEQFDRGMRFALMAYPPQGSIFSRPSSELEGKLAGGPVMTRLRTTLRGHTGAVIRSAFSPDGKRVVTASSDQTARLWDAETGKEIAVLKAHEGAALAAASWRRDGRRIVTAGQDNVARIWDVEWASTYGADLRQRVCASLLHGAQELTDIELEDPILRGITERNVCTRRGPLSPAYWTALPGQWWRSLRQLW